MKFIVAITVATLLLFGSLSAQDTCEISKNTPMTVSAAWLKEHIGHKNLVLLHIGDKAEYDAGHIAGAQYLSLNDISAPRVEDGLSLQMPTAGILKGALEKLGISNDSRIVVYFGKDWITPTTRAYFTLVYAGLENNASILEGGMPAWTAAGNAITNETQAVKPGNLKITNISDFIASADFVNQNLKNERFRIIDARAPVYYDGSDAGGMKRAGHIPAAKSIPYSSIVNEDLSFKTEPQLRKLFEDAGVKPYDTVVTYCHIGQQATLTLFAAKMLGYKYQLYDGSFQEWSSNRDLPVDDPKADERTLAVSVVSADWLDQHKNDKDVKILDVRGNVYDYFDTHVVNAVHLADAAVRGPKDGLPTQFFPPFMIGQIFGAAGIRSEDTVVVYSDGTGVLGATMIMYLLERIGHAKIAFVDGGLRDYLAGYDGAKGFPEFESARLGLLDNDRIGADLKAVEESIGKPGVKFVDARPPDVYRGEKDIWTRNGHIPGAVNIPWTLLVESNNPHKLKPLDELAKVYADAGVNKGDDVIVYCGTGREASLEYMVLKHVLKFPKVRLFEGSWAEYSKYARLRVEKSE